MQNVTIALTDEQWRKVAELAGEDGQTPDEWLQSQVAEWLARREEEFRQAAGYVLDKNRELYRRLA